MHRVAPQRVSGLMTQWASKFVSGEIVIHEAADIVIGEGG